MTETAEEMILDGFNGEKLLAYYSKQQGTPKGTVLLIHGWEGSSSSNYIINTGGYLFQRGYDIIRLNLRDHGESHHLNKGLFKSTLLDETSVLLKRPPGSINQSPSLWRDFPWEATSH
jgi:predicted alpha/beta-fold hydrolase